MNTSGNFYEGTKSEKTSVPQTHYLLEFQEKRREYLDKSTKQRRDELLKKSRELLLEAKISFPKDETEFEEYKNDEFEVGEDVVMNDDGIEDRLSRKFERMDFERPEPEEDEGVYSRGYGTKSNKYLQKKRLGFLPKLMTIPEWMIAPPSNLNGDYWLVYAKPDGVRCFIISTGSLTIHRDKNGFFEKTFISQLPGGCPDSDSGKVSILDCIFNKQLNAYFIMDVIIWKDNSMSLNSTESRFFFIESNILSDKKLTEKSPDNEYIFTMPKKYNCSVEGFYAAYNENTHYIKEGLLFAHKEAEYISGSNPYLLAWKDSFTSLYPIETDTNGLPTNDVQCVLELNDQDELQTLDDVVLATVSEEEATKMRNKRGTLFRVSIESISVNESEKDILKALNFNGVKVLKKSSQKRATADNISKIIFQYLIRNAPITAENIKLTIQQSHSQVME